MSQQQKLVLSIIDFLNKSIADGTVKQDDKESLEVAVQCIGEAFGVDPSDQQQVQQLSIKPASLQSIFDLFLKTRERVASASQPSSSTAVPPTANPPSAEDKATAEKHKQAGNAQMSAKKYDEAIDSYTKAIELDPSTPVFYSNRAAAYSSKGDNLSHMSAIADAEKAIEVDPSFIKAYHRLGHAHYCLNDYASAAAAFKKGLAVEPTNTSLSSALANAEARIADDQVQSPRTTSPENSGSPAGGLGGMDFGAMADMMRGMGGEGEGGPGGPGGLAGLLNNPAMMQMAQQMMGNGGLERMMQNPAIANMMNRVQSGGGMPSMAELMSDPSLRDLASQFGAGGPPPAR